MGDRTAAAGVNVTFESLRPGSNLARAAVPVTDDVAFRHRDECADRRSGRAYCNRLFSDVISANPSGKALKRLLRERDSGLSM